MSGMGALAPNPSAVRNRDPYPDFALNSAHSCFSDHSDARRFRHDIIAIQRSHLRARIDQRAPIFRVFVFC
jgi:hypothetical protein